LVEKWGICIQSLIRIGILETKSLRIRNTARRRAGVKVLRAGMRVRRVKEKEAELKEAERELHNRFDKLKASVADEKRTVEEQRRALDEEIAEFQVVGGELKHWSD